MWGLRKSGAEIDLQGTVKSSDLRRKSTPGAVLKNVKREEILVCPLLLDMVKDRMLFERASLADHHFSHSPSMAYPLAGCFVSAIILKLRHLCGFSVWQDYPCGEGRKGRLKRFSNCFLAVFLRLKRPPTFPLTRHFSTSNPAILHFFLNSVAWISRERR